MKNPVTRFHALQLAPATLKGAFRLTSRTIGTWDEDADVQLYTEADLRELRSLIDQALPQHVHNPNDADPDAHLLFDSICCGALLYRCSTLMDGLPSKPIVSAGEARCRQCDAILGMEAF